VVFDDGFNGMIVEMETDFVVCVVVLGGF